MAAVGVLYGYGSRDELIEAGASHVCVQSIDIDNPSRPGIAALEVIAA
jgi:phosphoglycolate phosphatase-like HAD superfamily hydrolase